VALAPSLSSKSTDVQSAGTTCFRRTSPDTDLRIVLELARHTPAHTAIRHRRQLASVTPKHRCLHP
jgi:hypothetical protein